MDCLKWTFKQTGTEETGGGVVRHRLLPCPVWDSCFIPESRSFPAPEKGNRCGPPPGAGRQGDPGPEGTPDFPSLSNDAAKAPHRGAAPAGFPEGLRRPGARRRDQTAGAWCPISGADRGQQSYLHTIMAMNSTGPSVRFSRAWPSPLPVTITCPGSIRTSWPLSLAVGVPERM